MNVFQNIGLPVNHRPSGKVVQLVRNFDERLKQLEKHFANGGVVFGQVKYDGVYAMAVITFDDNWEPDCSIFGRTGKKLSNVGRLESDFKEWAHYYSHPCVLIFELVSEAMSLEQLSGIVNPNRVEPVDEERLNAFVQTAEVMLHDMLAIHDLSSGSASSIYHDRYQDLICSGINRYVRGDIVKCYELSCVHECREFAQIQIDAGHEGAVFKMPDAGWVAGRKNEVAIKIVRGVDYDLLVTGVEYGKVGTKRAGMINKLLVRWREFGDVFGKRVTLPVDLAGFTDADREAWAYDPDLIVGKIVHVHALSIGSKGSLRLPKVKAIRIDKDTPDL